MANSDDIQFPTPAQVTAALTPPDSDDFGDLSEDEKKIALKLYNRVQAKANLMAEASKAREMEKAIAQLAAENARQLEETKEKIREANKPPDPKELEMLLSQEYIEFKMRVADVDKEFTIRELPQAVEMRYFKCIQKAIVPQLKRLAGADWDSGTLPEKLQKLIEMIPEAMEAMPELVAISLDPFEKNGVSAVWVSEHLSSNRQMRIIEAQIMASRFRDFFSGISRLFPAQMIA